MEFEKELETIINICNVENESNTPDFILAQYIRNCLNAFNEACNAREKWYGREKKLVEPPCNGEERAFWEASNRAEERIFKISEPHFIGEFPSVQEMKIETLEATDTSKVPNIGWTCSELQGWEVKVIFDDFDQKIMRCADENKKIKLIESCENMNVIKAGKKVLVMGITGWVRGIVVESGDLWSNWHVDTGGSIFPLKPADDERICWVTTSQINKKCFEKIKP